LREEISGWEPELITAAREAGVSWALLAPALGVTSRQAAERRYLRLQPTLTGEATGEGRVQVTRDGRAGDRAVSQWAQRNAAVLRGLAGQVSALPDLDAHSRRHADRVHEDPPATCARPHRRGFHLSAVGERVVHSGVAATTDAALRVAGPGGRGYRDPDG
jgi:hypothetical protein